MNGRLSPSRGRRRRQGAAGRAGKGQAQVAALRSALKRLRAEHERCLRFLDRGPYGVFVIDAAGRYRQVNRTICRMTGYRRQELLTMRLADLFAPSARAEGLKALNALRRTGKLKAEVDCRKKDGARLHLFIQASTNGDGRFQGFCLDITARKQTEQALRASEERYRGLFQESPLCLWECDLSDLKQAVDELARRGVQDMESHARNNPRFFRRALAKVRIVEANRAAVELFEASSKEQLCRRFVDLLDRNTREALKNQLGCIAAGKTSSAFETTGKTLRGASKHVAFKWSVSPGHETTWSKVLVSIVDVTERVQAEQTLRSSELFYRTTIDAMHASIHVVGPDLRFALFNAALADWCRRLGLPAPEIGLHVWEICPFLTDKVRREYRQVFKTGRSMLTEESVSLAGREILTETRKIPVIENGKVARVITVIRDVTQRRLAERALRESEERYRSFFEDSPISLWEHDMSVLKRRVDGLRRAGVKDFRSYLDSRPELVRKLVSSIRVINVNKATMDLYGARSKAELTSGLKPLFTKKTYETFKQALVSVAEGKNCFEYESSPRTLAGEQKHVVVHWSVAPAASRTWSQVLISVVDITQRKLAEQALQAAHQKLTAAGERERRQLAGELHDSISQKLVALKLDVQEALSALQADSARHAVRAIEKASKVCDSLIQEVRAMCHGLYPPALEPLGLVAALRRLADDCQPKARVTIRCFGGAEGARLSADVEIALYRIAQEALSNALRHGRARNVAIRLGHSKGILKLTIRDDGCGFDAKDASTWGLGMNTMRQRASAVGGQLQIASQPAGTRVQVTVPLRLLPSVQE